VIGARSPIVLAAVLISVIAAACSGSAPPPSASPTQASPTPVPHISLGADLCAFLTVAAADQDRLPTISTALTAQDWDAAAAALPMPAGQVRNYPLPGAKFGPEARYLLVRAANFNNQWLAVSVGIAGQNAALVLDAIPRVTASWTLITQALKQDEAAGYGCP